MPFKGGTRTYANRYHFNGGTPADATHWHTLMDAVTAAEKLILTPTSTITQAVGYAAGSDVPVASKAYSLAGTVTSAAGAVGTQGEAAALARWGTNARSTKNHPIYCFNYYHNTYMDPSGGNGDKLDSHVVTAMNTYGAAWITGFSDGTITAVRASPAGHAATGYLTEEWLTHRDFPYTPSA